MSSTESDQSSLSDDSEDNSEISFCLNCRREGIIQRDERITRSNRWYTRNVRLFVTAVAKIHFKLKACLLRNVYADPDEEILLCWQCHKALTPTTRQTRNPDYMWPAFMWQIVNHERVRKLFKEEVWSFFPIAWSKVAV